MKQLVECVPNFSEGRNENIIQSIVQSMKSIESVKVLDVDSGKDTNRTVVTIIGDPSAVTRSVFKLSKEVLNAATSTPSTVPETGILPVTAKPA